MPTTKERFDELEHRITAIETAGNSGSASSVQPTLAAKLLGLIVRNKATSIFIGLTVVGLIIAFFQLWYPAHSEHVSEDFRLRVDGRIDARLGDLRKDLGDVKGSLAEMKATLDTLKPFIQDLVHREMNKAAQLPSTQLQQSLPKIRNVLEVARDQRIAVDSKTIQTIEDKVRTLPRTEQFWQVSSDLISYRSFRNHEELARLQALPRCADLEPHPSTLAKSIGPGEQTVPVNPAYYENCQVQLDSPEQDERISRYSQRYVGLAFRHCLVIYRGGPVNLRIGLGALSFENCLLDFSIQATPPLSGQNVTEVLLARNIDNFKITDPLLRGNQP